MKEGEVATGWQKDLGRRVEVTMLALLNEEVSTEEVVAEGRR